MDKDTFLKIKHKLHGKVSLLQISIATGFHYNTVRKYWNQGGGKSPIIRKAIATAAQEQMQSKSDQYATLAKV